MIYYIGTAKGEKHTRVLMKNNNSITRCLKTRQNLSFSSENSNRYLTIYRFKHFIKSKMIFCFDSVKIFLTTVKKYFFVLLNFFYCIMRNFMVFSNTVLRHWISMVHQSIIFQRHLVNFSRYFWLVTWSEMSNLPFPQLEVEAEADSLLKKEDWAYPRKVLVHSELF